MKKLLLCAVFATTLKVVVAQNNQDQTVPATTQQTNPQQTNPSQNTNNWDLYGGSLVEPAKVPQSTSNAFSSKYADQRDVRWYSYPKGYIATYPGEDKSYQGVIYNNDGKMLGTVKRINTSTLPPDVISNIKKKYPDYNGEYVYTITSPEGKKTFVGRQDGEWIQFNETGVYMDKAK